MKMKLLILLCMAALPAMSVRAADNAEKPAEARILPDGVYRVRGEDSTEKGVTVKRCDTDGTVILLDRLTSQFGTASMTSAANDNTRFRIDLKSAGPFAEGEGTGHKALVIDGLCTMVWGQSDPDKQHRMDLSSQVVGKEASAKIAVRLGIEPRMRHHPGHRMEVRYLPKKPVFKPGEPVILRMEIRNVGDRSFTFVDGGQQRGPRNNQFGFTAFRSAGKGAELPDTGDGRQHGGPSGFITLEPGQVFGKEVDLTKWFDLSKPGTYKIEGRFEMNISRNPADCLIFGWDKVAQGTTMVTLGDGGAAVENADLPEEIRPILQAMRKEVEKKLVSDALAPLAELERRASKQPHEVAPATSDFRRGQAEAEADLKAGRARYFHVGMLSADSQLADIVMRDYGLTLVGLGCCPVPPVGEHAKGYNETVSRALSREFGPDFIKKSYEKDSALREQTRKRNGAGSASGPTDTTLVPSLTSVCNARPVAGWPYEKLAKEADLIVIATPTQTKDSGKKVNLPGIARDNKPVPAFGVNTTFEVLAVLKGAPDLKSFVLLHLREAEPNAISANGPSLVSFDPPAKKRYLMFLKREADGRFSSLCGQTDPARAIKDLGTYP